MADTQIALEFTEGAINVYAKPACEQGWWLVGQILEFETPNPLLRLYNPFGINGVRKIIQTLDDAKKTMQDTGAGVWKISGGKDEETS